MIINKLRILGFYGLMLSGFLFFLLFFGFFFPISILQCKFEVEKQTDRRRLTCPPCAQPNESTRASRSVDQRPLSELAESLTRWANPSPLRWSPPLPVRGKTFYLLLFTLVASTEASAMAAMAEDAKPLPPSSVPPRRRGGRHIRAPHAPAVTARVHRDPGATLSSVHQQSRSP